MRIREELVSLNSGDRFVFVIGDIRKTNSDFYGVQVEVYRNDKLYSSPFLESLSEFQALMSAIAYLGNCLRGIAKDTGIEFDLEGRDFDGYIPLSKLQRDVWEE